MIKRFDEPSANAAAALALTRAIVMRLRARGLIDDGDIDDICVEAERDLAGSGGIVVDAAARNLVRRAFP